MRSFVGAGWRFARHLSFVRFFLGLVLGLLLVALAWGTAFRLSLGLPLSFNERTIAAWYHAKRAVANRIKERGRIILVGGSNVFYGIDAQQIEKKTGIPTVNFGTHAALNLDYLLWRASKILRPEDVVILSLEWDHFLRGPFTMNEVSGPYLAGTDPDYVEKLPRADFLRLMMTSGWDRLLLPLSLSRKDNQRIQKLWEDVEGPQELDSFGDRIDNAFADKGATQRATLDDIKPNPNMIAGARTRLDDPVWRRLAKFVEDCRKKRITVWVSFPSVIAFPAFQTPESTKVSETFEANFRSIGATVLTSQADTLYPKDDFFDTIYHLHSEARNARTDLILSAMARAGIFSAAPSKP